MPNHSQLLVSFWPGFLSPIFNTPVAIVILAILLSVGPTLCAQTPDVPAANKPAAKVPAANVPAANVPAANEAHEPSQETASALPSYLEILEKIRENNKKTSFLYASIPVGFPQKQKQHMAQITQLKSELMQLIEQRKLAAVREFQRAPLTDGTITNEVLKMIVAKIDPRTLSDHFDPKGALELADLMLEHLSESPPPGGLPAKVVAYLAFRASVDVEDFGRAKAYLKRIEAAGNIFPKSIWDQLEFTTSAWLRELEFRKLDAAADNLPRVKFETSDGDFVVELFENQAPKTVGNFVRLVEDGFYDGLDFYRVKSGALSQTGCKENNGQWDAGYAIPCECDAENARSHFSGSLSMVNGKQDTGNTQFMIVHRPNQERNGKHTVFGRVIEGLDVVFLLNNTATQRSQVRLNPPTSIIKATVVRKREHPYVTTRVEVAPSGTIPDEDSKESTQPAGVEGGSDKDPN